MRTAQSVERDSLLGSVREAAQCVVDAAVVEAELRGKVSVLEFENAQLRARYERPETKGEPEIQLRDLMPTQAQAVLQAVANELDRLEKLADAKPSAWTVGEIKRIRGLIPKEVAGA